MKIYFESKKEEPRIGKMIEYKGVKVFRITVERDYMSLWDYLLLNEVRNLVEFLSTSIKFDPSIRATAIR